ncbi:hypothetical protein Ate01nite_34230 [Actinoplanes teichomyceticus]|nr:hypothetical protein Ate01nite_34230 [Actinoplanes teichomyceticus]
MALSPCRGTDPVLRRRAHAGALDSDGGGRPGGVPAPAGTGAAGDSRGRRLRGYRHPVRPRFVGAAPGRAG